LPFPERAEQVDDPIRVIRLSPVCAATFKPERLIRMLGAELGEEGSSGEILRPEPVDHGKVLQRRALSVLRAISHRARELIPRSKIEFLDDPGADIDVVIPRSVCRFPASDEARASWENFQDAEGAFLCHELFTVL